MSPVPIAVPTANSKDGLAPNTLPLNTLRKVHHIALNVRDMQASRYFYGTILGLHELTRDEIPATLTSLVAQGKVRNIADQAADHPYRDEYCCAVIVNGKYLARNPKHSAAATRALLKGAKWVEANPAADARLSVEGKYLASTADQNTFAISHLRYVPSVSGAQTAVRLAAAEMKTAGMLSPTTDVEALADRAFVALEGVSDQWLESLQVEKVAGAQVTPAWIKRQYARFNLSDVFCGLCLLPGI